MLQLVLPVLLLISFNTLLEKSVSAKLTPYGISPQNPPDARDVLQ
jgi:hypothetical protein